MAENEIKGDFESLKDIKNLDEFNFENIELIKGQTPKDIKEKCLQLCKDYLSGIWCQQTVHTIEVKRITGGLTNQLYYCGINIKCESEDVPQEVAIRLYGPKYFNVYENDGNERMSDVIIALMLSKNGVGPKVYGIFEEGQILKYYKHRQFQSEEQKNPELVRKLFLKLAKIHSMDIPIQKSGDWIHQFLLKSYNEAYEKFSIQQEIDEYNCLTLKDYDLLTEFNWIKGVVERIQSPVVFTHNDFRSSNVMITEPNDEIVVCDFEYSGYGYRGYDFADLMREWGRNIWDYKSIEGLPHKDLVLRPLIEVYIEECVKICGKTYLENDINSVEHILKEVKIFYLYYLLFGALYFFKNDKTMGGFSFGRKVSMVN